MVLNIWCAMDALNRWCFTVLEYKDKKIFIWGEVQLNFIWGWILDYMYKVLLSLEIWNIMSYKYKLINRKNHMFINIDYIQFVLAILEKTKKSTKT